MEINELVGYIQPCEIETLRHYSAKAEGVCVNIGTFQGKSCIAMALEHDDVYTIDKYEYELYEQYVADFGVKINKIVEDSNKVVWNKPIGLLFIDGDHLTDKVIGDYNNFKDHIVIGGTLIFHDYKTTEFGVVDALKELDEELMNNYVVDKCIGDMFCLKKIK